MNERIDDLIALAALGELTPAEVQELDDAVHADPVVAEELAAALTSAAALQSATAEEPPPSLKLSVMDAIAGLPQQTPADPGGDAPTTPVAEVPTGPSTPVAEVPTGPSTEGSGDVTSEPPADRTSTTEPLPEVRPIGSARSRRGIAPWIAAAAAAIVVVVGAVVVLSNDDGGTAGDEIAAVIDADDAVTRPVTGEIGDLQVVFSAEQDALVLTGDGIQAVPDDATYQVWLVADGAPTSVGIVAPDSDGALELRADGFDPTGATVAITIEPEGGSDQPTMPIVAATV